MRRSASSVTKRNKTTTRKGTHARDDLDIFSALVLPEFSAKRRSVLPSIGPTVLLEIELYSRIVKEMEDVAPMSALIPPRLHPLCITGTRHQVQSTL